MDAAVRHSVPQRCIGWQAAHAAAGAAAAEAARLSAAVNIALVDPAGLLAAFVRMPGAPLHSVEIAIDKAYTAASFGLPTARWHAALDGHSPAVRDGLLRRARFVAFGGGLPVLEGGERIGGIGVSGGSEAQDEAIARAGLAVLGLIDKDAT
ncbi:heme-binding protein [Xenophilus sp.]|uniref:heme-binding protein n=1 Tax=Xenophilus sp. TaxID=1873499 RepID=UPI0037DC466F